jgi:hypothetical protein
MTARAARVEREERATPELTNPALVAAVAGTL